MQNPANSTDPYWPQTGIFRFVGGSGASPALYAAGKHGDYGSWFTGIAATPQGMLYAGRSWRPTITTYDFRPGSPTFGNSTVPAGDNSQAFDPFGELEPNGTSYIRVIALIPGADYDDLNTLVYTSRNASMFDDTAPFVGGVAIWSGGTQLDPSGYRGQRAVEPGGGLDFGPRHPNGIALDDAGHLYVANSTSRWAKVYEMAGPIAFELHDLPSATTTRPGEQDPAGAPFEEPSGIVVDAAGTAAWVLDRRAQAAFRFLSGAVRAEPGAPRTGLVRLEAITPNPVSAEVSAEAQVAFALSQEADVRLAVYDALGARWPSSPKALTRPACTASASTRARFPVASSSFASLRRTRRPCACSRWRADAPIGHAGIASESACLYSTFLDPPASHPVSRLCA